MWSNLVSTETQDNSTTSNQDNQSPDYQESHPDQDETPIRDPYLGIDTPSDEFLQHPYNSICSTNVS